MPEPLPIDRPVRLAVVGLGQVAELVLPPYLERDDVEIVALCDTDTRRVLHWRERVPGAAPAATLDAMLAAAPDVVDVLVPTPAHADVVCALLGHPARAPHVQVQKPLARDLAGADRMLDAAARAGATLNVLEDYLCYPPLVKLRDLVAAGEIGDPVGAHLKIVAPGRGGWDVPNSSYAWQFEQARDGRGMLVFDHGWHQLALAMWLFGPIGRIFGWIGRTEIVPGIVLDAPATLAWEHTSGVRVALDITFARDMFFNSTHYTSDERVEVTGTRGFARCNRISAFGIQEPSVVVYRDGETRSFHALPDQPPDAFRAMAAHNVGYFRGAQVEPVMDGGRARAVLHVLLCALESSERGAPVDVT